MGGQLLVVVITTLLCIDLVLLNTPCFALHVEVPPRKLMAMQKEVVKTSKNEIVPGMKAKEGIIGGSLEVKMKAKKEEERVEKWEEVSEPSDLFTMDYRRVRRRQPIHNKSSVHIP